MGEEYERTVSGLLRKRREIVGELLAMRERQAALTNDLQCLDRVLQAFGHEANQSDDDYTPVRSRMIMFHKSELQQLLLDILRKANEPLSSRDLAIRFVTADGRDRYDKRLLLDVIKRVGKSISTLRGHGLVSGSRTSSGRYVWRLESNARRDDVAPRNPSNLPR